MTNNHEEIVVGGGCFWCIEAIYQGFKGIEKIESGYAGGSTDNPNYEQVSSGATGHAEVVRIAFNPAVINLKQILTIFFHAHDPTTTNRQGNDVGTQYRSIILYSSDSQHQIAQNTLNEIIKEQIWGNAKLVTEISPLSKFYPAEDYHQNYYNNNKNKPYCSIVIAPKIKKIREEFKELLK